ncbi:MAG TPA: TonB family protein [Pyrinomonadaceae bacterium]|nr:TonB family protein [Pyrinomonadaceae bacterium]
MLDQLVESKDTFKGLRTLLLLVLIITVIAATSAFGKFLWDLREHFIRSEQAFADLKLDEVESPVPVADDEPPPEPEKVIQKVEKVQQNVDVREKLMLDTQQSFKVPDTTSTQKNNVMLTKNLNETLIGKNVSNAKSYRKEGEAISLDKEGVSSNENTILQKEDEKEVEFKKPTPTPKKEEPTPRPVPKTVSGGVVNGKATRLVTPQYPSQARAVRASGQVSVAVTIDENGNVISASAVSGHTLLRGAAESAARSSKFAPTLLSGQPVKVTGTIIYNFVP